MTEFAHLHLHTEYSLLDGATRIKELMARVRELGMDSVALTDHGAMFGAVEFYREAKDAGVHPVIGCEMYVCADMKDKSYAAREYSHLLLLCKNDTGYQNLIKLVSLSYTEGFYYKPRIDYELLERYCEGLICSSACLSGDIPQYINDNRLQAATDLALRLKGMFGEDFYFELQNMGILEQRKVNRELIRLSRELDIPLIATNDVHYLRREDAVAQDVLMCIQTGRYFDEADRMKFPTEEFYLKSPEEMAELFADVPEAIANTEKVAKLCNVTFTFGKIHLPVYDVSGMTHEEYLKKLALEGLGKRYPEITPELSERLSYELSVINSMGFTDYFLIVWDYVNYAKSHGIAVGPGRGSGAGSLTAYCLNITGVDPIKYGLLFERFLNPERLTMPDIDVDFCQERRDEVIAYVVKKYGVDRVAQIITFGTLGARQVIRDVSRVMRLPIADADRIAKLVPRALDITIDGALDQNPRLKAEYDNKPEIKEIIDVARRLEGLARHTSVHAAGVVIANKPVSEYVPLATSPKGGVMTQFPMGDLEKLGLLKMDFLGLRNLTIIQHAVEMIKEDTGVALDMDAMEFDDLPTYELITSGDTDGVFQLESPGMRDLMTKLKPRSLLDITDGISLYRPGPMDYIPAYIAGRNDRKNIRYLHPLLEPILKSTYGVIVYQEQVMEIVRALAGYSMGRSDLVRRAMSKKKAAVMDAERTVFINGETKEGAVSVEGAVRRGVPEHIARQIFEQMTDFAQYAFNKSHACGYAVIAYQTAYLKCHYPLEFLAALINSYLSDASRVASYMQYIRKSGIKILPPDINRSKTLFSVEGNGIRFGLSAIRDVGEKGVEDIIAERENGPFTSFGEFLRRTCGFLNKRMLEGLIHAGCFDSMGIKRAQLQQVFSKALDRANNERKSMASGQLSLFSLSDDTGMSDEVTLPDIPELPERLLLDNEKQAVGAYLSGHPLNGLADVIEKSPDNIGRIMEARDNEVMRDYYDGRQVTLIGVLSSVERRYTRLRKLMVRATLEDLYGVIKAVVFPAVAARCEQAIVTDTVVRVSAKTDINDIEPQLIIEAIEPYEGDASRYMGMTLYIRLPHNDYRGMDGVLEITGRHPGTSSFVVYVEDTGAKTRVGGTKAINLCDGLLAELREMYGENNVVVK